MTSAERAAATHAVRDLTGVALSTPRLILREFREADIDAIAEACQDDEIQRYTMLPTPYGRADAERFVRKTCPAGRAAGTDAGFGVFTAETAETADAAETGDAADAANAAGSADTSSLVGAVGLHNIAQVDEPAGGTAGIGYWTAPWARRHGYTTEAVGAVCRWGFQEFGLALIRWDAIVGNDGSWEVARRNGFVREGTRRASLLHRGVRRDMWVGSLLAAEFAER